LVKENTNTEQIVENEETVEEKEELLENEDTQEEDKIEEPQNNESNEAKLQAEIESLKKEKEEVYQRLLRAQADFENFRRRTTKERENDLKYRSQEVVMELLPVIDNFERALQVEVTGEGAEKFVEGMKMIYRQLLQVLENSGVEEIKAEGEPFDPHVHQAVMQVEEADKESNMVIEVFQKGYKLKDRVIRPAMVKVSQ
jgi:molecular chaperone GrpE